MDNFDVNNEGRVAVHVHSEPWAGWAMPRTVLGEPGVRMRLGRVVHAQDAGGKQTEIEWVDDATGLTALNTIRSFGTLPIMRRQVRITNTSHKPFALDVLHSAFFDNIPWTAPGQFVIHIPANHNYAEGQWRSAPLEELGLTRSFKKGVPNLIVSALGRSCDRYLPSAVLEDRLNNRSLAWQVEHCGAWMWDLGQGLGDFLNLGIGGLTEAYGHWFKVLRPGESVESLPAAAGWVAGGVDEAFAAMTEYRRQACKSPHPVDWGLPVIFNDYMNCLWGKPNEEKSLRLIPRAAEAGAEIYCMDAGWFGRDEGWGDVGDWRESRAKFPKGLKSIMDAVRERGMIPGLWVEIEAVSESVEAASRPDDWFLSLHGKRNLFSGRFALDFRNPAVRRFADETIDRLIGDYRLGYVKFDYNFSVQLGTDFKADSPGDGALEHHRAVLDWYRALRARHPRVILENCSSGGMRNDYAMLSILQLASSSDQTRYDYYPAIVTGSAGAILPEQLGVWAYPKKADDREATVFNMVNALLARVHLSGEIADWSKEQRAIVREAIALYKGTLRSDIPRSIPFWPLGQTPIERRDAFQALGLRVAGENRAWLAVWRLESESAEIEMPVRPASGKAAMVEQVFPCVPQRAAAWTGSHVRAIFPQRLSAALFRISW